MQNADNNIGSVNIRELLPQAIEKAGLSEKGIKFTHIDVNNWEDIYRQMEQQRERNPIAQLLGDNEAILKKIKTNLKRVADGQNAFNSKGKIYINLDKTAGAVFHELGHSVIENLRPVMRKIQHLSISLRKKNFVLGSILSIALFLNVPDKKKQNDNNALEKTIGFVKNNVGKLAALTFLPTLITEAAASIEGRKIAKELLSPENLKKVDKVNLR